MKQFSKFLTLGGAFLLGSGFLLGQAPPGPLTPPPPEPGSVAAAPPVPRKPEVAPRKNIMGAWKFNKDESDDPHDRLRQAQGSDSSNPGGGPGGPRVGFPGPPMGGPGGSGGGGYGGHRNTTPDEESGRLGNMINPARELQLIRHSDSDPEVEMFDDRGRRLIFYTDGRKIEKQKDPSLEEISAHWEESKLVTDEKGPHNGKVTRTFEVSKDGRQLLETIRVTDSKGNHPINVNYVYDAVEASSLGFPPH